ncbi:MAG: ATP-dependent DNA helicase RecG, partial [Bacteroidales bacterium]|nr:ATP-dependent DNA helicase RecG [Bacteroidales bacterium]
MDLTQELTYLKGVGPSRAEILAKELNITCQEDLLYYFPYKYIDRSRIHKIAELQQGMPYIQVCGRILDFRMEGEGRGKRLVARLADDTGILELVWFKGVKYVESRYNTKDLYLVFGKPAQFGNKISLAHPDLDVANEGNLRVLTG